MSQSKTGHRNRPAVENGELVAPVSLQDLPPPDTARWVTRRKAEVVAGVWTGLLSLDEACRRYNLSAEEFHSWERLIERHGVSGLRVTRLQHYRREPEPVA
ncbi:DUF1153 domain-containing protein [Oleisolibacter albus]|uniref:CtrA inhibitor SciP n=1 Tax=Oleisolibacter albus TaxID=2171757 RepID=UPI000DF2FF7C|nr:DUF1153 domain-containing protein [Oleisolibacter albus]